MPSAKHTLNDLTAEFVRSILDYDPETGVFRWRKRDIGLFHATKKRTAEHIAGAWNTRYAGKVAGCKIWTSRKELGHTPYLYIGVNDRLYRAHRLAWLHCYGEWPKAHVDHVDGDGLNNRISNLRAATRSENLANIRTHRDNRSGHKGVSFHRGRYRARILKNGKELFLGYFDTPEEANAAYADEAARLHGEFANRG